MKEAFPERSQTSKMELKAVNYFRKKLRLRYFTGFWTRLWVAELPEGKKILKDVLQKNTFLIDRKVYVRHFKKEYSARKGTDIQPAFSPLNRVRYCYFQAFCICDDVMTLSLAHLK